MAKISAKSGEIEWRRGAMNIRNEIVISLRWRCGWFVRRATSRARRRAPRAAAIVVPGASAWQSVA
jgi:hypothetical protein